MLWSTVHEVLISFCDFLEAYIPIDQWEDYFPIGGP